MHNFLAETVDFFLDGDDQGGKLTSFRSQPQPEEGWVLDANTTYYMDVKLTDTSPMNRFVEYDGVKEHVQPFWLYSPTPRNGAEFGYQPKIISGSTGVYAVAGDEANSLQ